MGLIATIRESFRSLVSPAEIVEAESGLDPLATPSLVKSAPVSEPVGAIHESPSGAIRELPLRPDTSVVGATGTPIFYEGFRVYEQMRRSDADVAAALAACKLPIRAADWQVVAAEVGDHPDAATSGRRISSTGEGKNTQAKAKEVAEFVRENLFGGLESPTLSGHWMTQSFESVIENALLSLDFGCAAHEDLWHVEGGRVRLRRLAGRLPLTFYRFHVEPDGETLVALEQWGYRGDDFVNVRVPADMLMTSGKSFSSTVSIALRASSS